MEEQLEDLQNPDKASCDADFFMKFKYSYNRENMYSYSDFYDISLIKEQNGQILLEIVLNQDSQKTASFRDSTQILDFLGDIGGF